MTMTMTMTRAVRLRVRESGASEADGEARACRTDAERYRLLDEAMDALGTGRFQYLLIGVTGLGYFVEAAEMTIVSLLYPAFIEDWGVSETDLSIVQSWTAIGMVIGCTGGGRLSDAVGRKLVYEGSVLLSVVFGLASSLATGVVTFSAMRLLLGIGYGGALVNASPLLLESVPSSSRAWASGLLGFFFCAGSTFIVMLSWALMDSVGWAWMVRISSLVGLPVLVCLRAIVPESVRFCVMRGRYAEAVAGMQRMARMNGAELPGFFTEANLAGGIRGTSIRSTDSGEVAYSKETRLRPRPGLALLAQRDTLRTLLPLMLIWFVNSFALAITMWLPLELSRALGGDGEQFRVALVTQVGEWGGAVLVATLFFRLPYIVEIRAGSVVLGATLLLIGILSSRAGNTGSIYGLLVLQRIGLSMVMHGQYTFSPIAFPTEVRVMAFSMCQLAHRAAPVFSPFLLTVLDERASFEAAATVYAMLFFTAAVLTVLLDKKTAGGVLVETEDEDSSAVSPTSEAGAGPAEVSILQPRAKLLVRQRTSVEQSGIVTNA